MTQDRWELLFKRDDLAVSEVRDVAAAEPAPGQVVLAVEKFGLTANNATYARFGGSAIPFWDAFPGPEGYGRVPVWGFVRVERSGHPDIAEGSRYFGYVPMSTHYVVTPQPVANGFFDTTGADFLHPWYRTFQAADEPDQFDDVRAVMRPVFPASFNLADLLQQQVADGLRSVLVTSASAKSAIGMLAELASRGVELPAVGVTSARHVPFVEHVGGYGTVLAYEDFDQAGLAAPTGFVDFTGSPRWRAAAHRHCGADLRLGVLIGFTHSDAAIDPPPGLTDPQPEVFFTPAVEDMAVQRDGADAYFDRYRRAEQRFLESAAWLRVQRGRGPEEIVGAFQRVLSGEQEPDVSPVLRP